MSHCTCVVGAPPPPPKSPGSHGVREEMGRGSPGSAPGARAPPGGRGGPSGGVRLVSSASGAAPPESQALPRGQVREGQLPGPGTGESPPPRLDETEPSEASLKHAGLKRANKNKLQEAKGRPAAGVSSKTRRRADVTAPPGAPHPEDPHPAGLDTVGQGQQQAVSAGSGQELASAALLAGQGRAALPPLCQGVWRKGFWGKALVARSAV